ncbi:MAG: hypothetical protein JWS12_619 [Candidatus Saccharibacteria bacterium]|nr:hypothetical protein [Candidatus Saccharibacteria bacterium]
MFDDIKLPSGQGGAKTDTAKIEAPATDNKPAISGELPSKVHASSKGRRFHIGRLHINRKWLLIGGVSLLVISAGVTTFMLMHKKPKPVAHVTVAPPVPPPVPTTVAAGLSGLLVTPDQAKRPVRGFMIENSPDARPQSGLTQAEVVYEAVAEGGITRFLALFQVNEPSYIGPVRSARPYYLDFLLPYDAALAHAGGSPDALAAIKTLGVKDLDQFANSDSYQRVSNRYAPHNLYTGMNKIDALLAKKGYTSSTFTGFARKGEAASATPNAKSIDFNISSFLYNPHWDYDAPTNTYKRGEGGKPHIDEKSGAQIAPKVVVAVVMNKGLAADHLHSTYATTGNGQIFVFQDGMVTAGTWSKAGSKNPFVFGDAAGKPLALNPGQTWVSIVDATSKVVYK